MRRNFVFLLFAVEILCVSSNRGENMRELAGGKYVCRRDLSEWQEYVNVLNEGKVNQIRSKLLELIQFNQTRVLECTMGVISGLVRVGEATNDLGVFELAMVYVYTLRSGNRILPEYESKWNVSTRGITDTIQALRQTMWNTRPVLPSLAHKHAIEERIGIVSICMYSEEYLLARETPKNRYMYAQKHGYEALVFGLDYLQGRAPTSDVQHSKLALLSQLLRTGLYDWLVWMDCDSVIINMDKELSEIITQYAGSADLLISRELFGLSSANFFVKHSPWSIAMLDRAFDTVNTQFPLFGDQDGLIIQVSSFLYPEVAQHVVQVPQNEFNAYDALNAYHMNCASYEHGDLLVTFPQCRDVACNTLFAEAFSAAANGGKIPTNRTHAQKRVFGPYP